MITSIATKRAIGYCRVSTTAQAGERHSSLDTQKSRFLDYCQRNNLLSGTIFVDTVSGRKDDRKAYLEMVHCALSGGTDVVLVQWLDRFGRNPREILRRYWELEERGVSVVAIDEDIKEELNLLIRAFMAGAESRKNSERVRANMSKAIAKGVHVGKAPYGVQAVKEIKDGRVVTRWEMEPTESQVVRKMYQLSVEENKGYKVIADRLEELGYKAKGGLPFKAYTVQTILENEAIAGTLTYGKRPRKGNPQTEVIRVANFFPVILNAEEWVKLQQRLAIRREHPRGKAQSSTYLLSGMLRCGSCGGPMVGGSRVKDGKGGYHRWYYCSNARRAKALCPQPVNGSAPKLELAIVEYLGQFSDPDKVRALLAASEKNGLERDEKELQAIGKRLAELESAFLKDMDRLDRGLINEKEFGQRNQARRADAETLKVRQAELTPKVEGERSLAKQVDAVPQAIRSFLEDYQTMDIVKQKAQLQTILKAAHVYRNGRIELEFRDS